MDRRKVDLHCLAHEAPVCLKAIDNLPSYCFDAMDRLEGPRYELVKRVGFDFVPLLDDGGIIAIHVPEGATCVNEDDQGASFIYNDFAYHLFRDRTRYRAYSGERTVSERLNQQS